VAGTILTAAILAASFLLLPARTAAVKPVQIAVHASMTREGKFSGQALAEAARMAASEVNATAGGPRIELIVVDDQSRDDAAAEGCGADL
jgi:ABC-type branched-subunit amino acid transport system substrate-binding protein